MSPLTFQPSTHEALEMRFAGQEALSYTVILPKGWIRKNDFAKQADAVGRLVRIGSFVDQESRDATVVEVFWSRTPFEVNVRDWLEFNVSQSGMTLEYCKETQLLCGAAVEAGGVAPSPAAARVVRMAAHADGARLFLISASTPQARYAAEQNTLAVATHFFRLAKPSGSAQLEQWLLTEAGAPAFRLAYPMSWDSRPVEKPAAGKSAIDLLLARDEHLAAYLRVKASGPAGGLTPDQILQTAIEELREAGIVVQSAWQADRDRRCQGLEGFCGAYVAQGQFTGQPIALHLGIVERGSILFVATLISVLKSDNPVLWMRSQRAYEIALATVSPVP